jgi:hypothetical protein
MAIMRNGYLARYNTYSSRTGPKYRTVRNWWLVKYVGNSPGIALKNVVLPKELLGKRVRLKVEIIEDDVQI